MGPWSTLPPGLIVEVARAAGIEVRGDRAKEPICCPFHDDRTPSAVLFSESNVLHCPCCGSFTARAVAERLGVPWPIQAFTRTVRAPRKDVIPFTHADAQRVWALTLRRAFDDDCAEPDAPVYAYLQTRGLAAAWNEKAFGVVAPGMDVPPCVAWWPGEGYRVLAPLYDSSGCVANVAVRAIVPKDKRVLVPKGSATAGTVFANRLGLELLRGSYHGPSVAVLGEGLSDYLAFSIVATVPVFTANGVGGTENCIGPWAQGLAIVLALDCDRWGEAAIQTAARSAFRNGAAEVHRLTWPPGCKDAADTLQRLGTEGLALALDRVVAEVSRG